MSIRHAAIGTFASALAICTLAAPATAQQTCVDGHGHWGSGPPEAVEQWSNAGEHLLAIGEGAVLALYDSSNPQAPVRLGEVLIGDPVRYIDIAPDGQTAAVSDGRRRVHLVDIGNRATPARRGAYSTTGTRQPYGMDTVGNRLYVAVRQQGVVVLDTSNRDAPVAIGQSSGPVTDYVFDVEIRGNYAYLAQRNDGVRIVNITTPANPVMAGSYTASSGAADIRIVGARAYVSRGSSGVDILDLTNATTPTRLSTFGVNGAYLYETELIGSQHVAVSSTLGTSIYSIATPASPVLAGTVSGDHYRLASQGNHAFTVAGSMGGQLPRVAILDVNLPMSPAETAALVADGPSFDVRVGAGQVLVASGLRGLTVLDTSNPLAPVVASRLPFPEAEVKSVERVNGIAVAGAYGRMWLVDTTSNPAAPTTLASIDTGFQYSSDLASRGAGLYVAAAAGGLRHYDLAVPTAPQLVWTWTSPSGLVQRVAIDGDMAYAAHNRALHVLHIDNPSPPVEIDGYTAPTNIMDIAAAGGFIYLATQTTGVRVIDNRVPGTMTEVADIPTPLAIANGVAVEGDRLYIAAQGNTGLLIYDVADPANPLFIEERSAPGDSQKVAVRNGIAAFADGGSGVRTYVCDADAVDRIFRGDFEAP